MTPEASNLSELIGDIYDAALDPTLWSRALERTCSFVGGSSAALFWHDAAAERSAVLHLFNEDPHYTQLYFSKYFPMNPLFPAATFFDAGAVYTSPDVMPFAELHKSRFYTEWLKPQGIVDAVSSNLEKSAASSSMVSIRLTESDGLADADAKRRLELLVPHFQRAVSIGRLFDQSGKIQAVLTETLDSVEAAVFLVGPNARIVFVNQAGRAMLDEGVLLHERRGLLAAMVPEASHLLRDMLVAIEKGDMAASGNGVAIPLSASPHSRWFAHVLPLTSGDRRRTASLYSAVAAVFVRRTSPAEPLPLEALARLYKFTASEIRMLDAVMKVSGVRALADLLGLSQATVKTHLHNVFRKTGTNRQSELVKLIAGFEPAATDDAS